MECGWSWCAIVEVVRNLNLRKCGLIFLKDLQAPNLFSMRSLLCAFMNRVSSSE